MPEDSPPSPAVVVGIDGSSDAVDAAVWAIEEAIDRDLPLRLLYAIEPRATDSSQNVSTTRDLVTAEAALRCAALAVESVERPVKVEADVVRGQCVDALVNATWSAAMVCVGARGIGGARGRRVGSTVTALVARARCPVAIVRRPTTTNPWVAVEFDHSDDAEMILARAVEEARIRNAPLRVLIGRRPTFAEIQDAYAIEEMSRIAKAEIERSLACWRVLYPDVDIRAVAVPGNPLNYVARHVDSIGLLVLGHEPSDELFEFAGPIPDNPRGPKCSVLVCEARPPAVRGEPKVTDGQSHWALTT
jgi:nucleotide-binding universal stress UspA family protein